MNHSEILPLILGQSGALVLALAGLVVLWRELRAAQAELRAEHQARLADARSTTEALVGVHREVNGAIDRLVTVAELMTSGRSPPPLQSKGSTSDAKAFARSVRGPAE